MKRAIVLALAAAFVGVGLAGCGERPQTVSYKAGKFRGKPDTRPWDDAPPAGGRAEWKKGDEMSWDNQIRSRAAAQNEYGRIGH